VWARVGCAALDQCGGGVFCGGLRLRLRRRGALDGCGRVSAAPPSTGGVCCGG